MLGSVQCRSYTFFLHISVNDNNLHFLLNQVTHFVACFRILSLAALQHSNKSLMNLYIANDCSAPGKRNVNLQCIFRAIFIPSDILYGNR